MRYVYGVELCFSQLLNHYDGSLPPPKMETNMIRNTNSPSTIDDAFRNVIAAEILPLKAEIEELRSKFINDRGNEYNHKTANKILRKHEIALILSISKFTWDRAVKNGFAPAPISLGQRGVGWRLSDVEAYIAGRRNWPDFATSQS
jgi:predicted DNA-binding transcriptional regulator AlpA